MLNQATGQNVASQASLMAGQRGSGANAGLMARQAAQQGAATQQQAVGQGATMQANQSLNALSAAGNMANNQAAQQAQATSAVTNANQSEQSNILNAIAGQNNANVGMQSNINSANTALAGQEMQSQNQLLGSMMPSAGSAMQMLADGGEATEGDSGVQVSAPQVSSVSIPSTSNPFTSSSGGGGKGGGLLALLADGGGVQVSAPQISAISIPSISNPFQSSQSPKQSQSSGAGPKSTVGKAFASANNTGSGNQSFQPKTLGDYAINGIKSLFSSPDPNSQKVTSQDIATPGQGNAPDTYSAPGAIDVTDQTKMAHGGKVPALVSPGEIRIKAKDVKKVAEGKKSPMSGEKIPGKPKVGGAKNDYANDTVPKTLNEGDIILPRSVTQSKHPHWAAHKFVQDIMMQKHRKK